MSPADPRCRVLSATVRQPAPCRSAGLRERHHLAARQPVQLHARAELLENTDHCGAGAGSEGGELAFLTRAGLVGGRGSAIENGPLSIVERNFMTNSDNITPRKRPLMVVLLATGVLALFCVNHDDLHRTQRGVCILGVVDRMRLRC
jgi:hypothetical protein